MVFHITKVNKRGSDMEVDEKRRAWKKRRENSVTEMSEDGEVQGKKEEARYSCLLTGEELGMPSGKKIPPPHTGNSDSSSLIGEVWVQF
ncbi:hypothetical protein AB6A40_000666 [Gnathostoma spinigerum]|uniref:Uncharacterized protein n=1 Tax=Gnathostoma spinigerum TaxID=75299 RepID=A0ABD6EBT9_9BILA